MLEVIEIPREEAGIYEALGSKAKFWYEGNTNLFKIGRPGTGENWAEVVAAEIAAKLNLPHATYKLARCGTLEGVSTPNFVPRATGRLILGNELLPFVVSASATERSTIRRQFHTVPRLAALLSNNYVLPPRGWTPPIAVEGAAGTMCGYLMLDALIGNQDRHEENWGLVLDGELHLAPTFDHASSLGRNETDDRRLAKLSATDPSHSIDGYSRKACSQLFGPLSQRLKTIEAFYEFATRFPNSANYWLTMLRNLSCGDFDGVLDSVPPDWISVPAKEFAVRLLCINRARLLELDL